MRVAIDEFRLERVAPAHARCDVLQGEIADAEALYRQQLAANPYDDAVAAVTQGRIADLRRDLKRWERRLEAMNGKLNAQTSGSVEV